MTPSLASPKMRKAPVPLNPPIDEAVKPSHLGNRADMGSVTAHSGKSAAIKSPERATERMPEKAVEKMAEMMSEIRQMQRKIRSECRDVGNDFAEEARKIHYGEAAPEGIYGHASAEERAELDDEGIDIVEMPLLPLDN